MRGGREEGGERRGEREGEKGKKEGDFILNSCMCPAHLQHSNYKQCMMLQGLRRHCPAQPQRNKLPSVCTARFQHTCNLNFFYLPSCRAMMSVFQRNSKLLNLASFPRLLSKGVSVPDPGNKAILTFICFQKQNRATIP